MLSYHMQLAVVLNNATHELEPNRKCPKSLTCDLN